MNDFIKVNYEVYSTPWFIRKKLDELSSCYLLSFDTETRSVYNKIEREEAKVLLKDPELVLSTKKFCLQVFNSSGLSFPSLVKVTHFIFGLSSSESIIFIATDIATEMLIWKWMSIYQGIFLIHGSLFDLKLMYHRVGCFPPNFEDTQLASKVFINNAEVWKANTGLKELMSDHYDPKWSLYNDYEPEDLKDPKFLNYCACDGAATFKLWEEIEKHNEEFGND